LNYNTIKYEAIEKIGYLTLNNPPSNPMNSLFFEEMKDFVMNVETDNLSAIIIQGAGRHFSSGAELDDLLSKIAENGSVDEFFLKNSESFNFFNELNIPVIAIIRGICIGSAFELALNCHFRFCTENAVMGLPESTFNLMPGCGGSLKLVSVLGKVKALNFLLTGSSISSAEALELNLIDKILPKNDISEFSVKFAKTITVDYNHELKNYYMKKHCK
jgi:enoyl-CoA hydratase/carnithine racemase